ncbi:hypothetical protein GCM10027294_37930 [Marinactinospora endophytica]
MSWDRQRRETYDKEVLEQARVGRRVPPDLFERYGIDAGLRSSLKDDPAAFSAHVTEVNKYWKSKQRGVFKKTARDLCAEHDRLAQEGRLTYADFERESERAEERLRAEVEELAHNIAITTTHIDRARLGSYAASVGASPRAVEHALRAEGVRVVALPEIPARSPSARFATLTESLKTRGVDFSPVVVFGEERVRAGFRVLPGFRLDDGGRLDDAALTAAARRIEVEAYTDRKTAAEKTIAILRAEREVAARDAIVLWEIVADLRGLPSGIAERGLAQRWIRRGLDPDDAGRIAAAIGQAQAADPQEQAEAEVRDLLADGLLRAAQRAAAALPGDHDLQARLGERAAEVIRLDRIAAERMRRGRAEEAAHALHQALELAADDDDLAERLAAIPPLPPGRPRARVDGDRIVVTWSPSPSQYGDITYQVVRRSGRGGAAGEIRLTTTGALEYVDTTAEVGTEVRYGVSAIREGRARSATAVTGALMRTPDVTGVRLTSVRSTVTASWRKPPRAIRVDVLRGEGGPPRGVGDGVRIETGDSGFRDTALRPGVLYCYRIQAVYLTPDGRTRLSPGVLTTVTPTAPLSPVRDLALLPDPAGTGTVRLTWTPPEYGEVVLRRGGEPPRWAPGTAVDAAELDSFGPELPRSEEIVDGRAVLELTVPAGRHHLLATTTSGGGAVVGDHVEVVSSEPVRGLRAERLDQVTRLSWTWPERSSTALVSWGETGTETEQRCSRRRYEAEGGFEAPVGTGTVRIRVRAVVATLQGELIGPPTELFLQGRSVIDYHIRPSGLFRRRRRIELRVDRPCDIPEIAVVHCAGSVQPYSAHQEGVEILERIPGRRMEPEEPVSVEVTLPGGSGPGWLMCFVSRREDETYVKLRQPSVKELRLR